VYGLIDHVITNRDEVIAASAISDALSTTKIG
jgi:hypothetical protein